MLKPPIGLEPKSKNDYDREEIDLSRGVKIIEAMWRFYTAGWVFPTEWSDELDGIQASMYERRLGGDFKNGTIQGVT